MYLKAFFLLFYSLSLSFFSIKANNPDSKPNIILIIVDDLGWRDVGFMGSFYYQTPNLDLLAKHSRVFTQAYAGAANCAPSRAVLMSGQYPTRHGVYTVSPSTRGKAKDRKLIPTPNIRHLEDRMLTLSEALKAGGYVTGTFGKWHVGNDPMTQGFDVNVGGSGRGNPGRNGYFSPYNLSFMEDGPEGEYLPDRLTAEAIRFMQTNRDTSFFLYLPYYTVHTPLNGPQKLRDKYKNFPPIDGQGQNADYAAMIEAMDANIGRILSEKSRLNLDNTIVIFTSDNGGIATVSRQWPLRAGKGSYYEGGIRVPFLIHGPEISPGIDRDLPFSFLDLYPTMLKLANVPIPTDKILDGISVANYLQGASAPREIINRPLIWHFPIYLEAYRPGRDDSRDPLFRTRPGSVIRMGNWKLHQYFEEGGLELYDLSQDPGERISLAEAYPQKAQEILQILEKWQVEMRAPIPQELNPEYGGRRK